MKMGWHSGFNGKRGQRVKPAPTLFVSKTPSAALLGIPTDDSEDDPATWPLHAKDVGPMDHMALADSVKDPLLREAVHKAVSFLNSSENYGLRSFGDEIPADQLPFSHFNPQEMAELLRVGKVKPLPPGATIRCGCAGFKVKQPAKRRLRPVFEPSNNNRINREALPPLQYMPRRQRRYKLARLSYRIEFDFSGYFDQLYLAKEVLDCFVIRVKEPIAIDGIFHTEFTLTREPMGATHSAHVAQTLTWAVLEPILKMGDVFTSTMIDNVALASDNAESFVAAVQLFIERCDAFRFSLNDRDSLPTKRDDILGHGRRCGMDSDIDNPFRFLGGGCIGTAVRNSANNVKKLSDAIERIGAAAALAGAV
jgi:hypothetical protein